MDNKIIVKKGKAKLFSNPILEFFSKTNPIITLLAYIPLILFFIFFSVFYLHFKSSTLILLSCAGFFSWTLAEYLLHRFLFHYVNDNKYVKKFHYIIHGVHHEYPFDENRLFMPPLPGYIIATFLFLLFYLFLNLKAFCFFPGFLIGYLSYVFIHYTVHKFKKPKNKFKILWEHHNLHHYKYPDKAFGVSSPFWDIVFKTMPPKKTPQP